MTPQMQKDLRTARKIVTQDSARRFVKRATYSRINERRAELIDRDVFDKNLNHDEINEMRILDQEVDRLTSLAYPLPPLPDLSRLGYSENS